MAKTAFHANRMHLLIKAPLLLALMVWGLACPTRARAEGTFLVNSTTDTNEGDTVLTLREALAAANGSLVHNITDEERALLGGCTFWGGVDNWHISGGCGSGVTDTINFNFTSGTITLNSALPDINDSAPTYLHGPNTTASEIVIDGHLLPNSAGTSILKITSNNNGIDYSLAFANSPAIGIYISGDTNDVAYAQIYGTGGNINGGFGLVIDGGSGNFINGVELGFRSLNNPTACDITTNNITTNVLLKNGAQYNELIGNTVVCTGSYGIRLDGTNTAFNELNSNRVGIWLHNGTPYNMGDDWVESIAVTGGSHDNQILDNTIGWSVDGVYIKDAGSNGNVIQGNEIGKYASASIPNLRGVTIDNDCLSNQVLDNTIANNQVGVYIGGSSTPGNNLVEGNDISNNALYGMLVRNQASGNTLRDNTIYSNGGPGVYFNDQTSGNLVQGGSIHGNAGAGILEAATAGPNKWTHLSLYGNNGLGIDKLADGAPTPFYPVITSLTPGAGGTFVIAGTGSVKNTVELYQAARDPSGFGEGWSWMGSAFTDSGGNWQITVTGGGCFTAFQTSRIIGTTNSSEFGPATGCAFLPFITR